MVTTLAAFSLLWQGCAPDAIRDASGPGQLFERIEIEGFTDLQKNTGGTGLVDIDRDGLLDIVAVYTQGDETLRVFQNQGDFQFTKVHERPLHDLPRQPSLIDFNNDGWLDIMLTHIRGYEDNPGPGNVLLVTQSGPFDWVDLGEQMGIRNADAYNCESSIGDIDGDGWLDIAVAADHIGDMTFGTPRQRLYRFVPNGEHFEDGHFIDLGGTDQIPGYGGPVTCDANIDLGGPSAMLRDFDNDGDLDLLRLFHTDMLMAAWDHPCASGEQWQGVYLWKGLLAETGESSFERVTDNGLAYSGRMFYDQNLGYYVPDPDNPDAVGFNNMSAGDVNNDGLLDIIAVGSTDPQWQGRAGEEAARLWYNLGDMEFEEATSFAGLDSLNWTYFEWGQLWNYGFLEKFLLGTSALIPDWTNQAPLLQGMRNGDMKPYYGDVVFGDFNNDGWLDFVAVDRHEVPIMQLRHILYMNRGDGTFDPVPTTMSGIDNNSIAAEADDLNGDGLLDLVLVALPGNSAGGLFETPPERFMDTVYYNTGAEGACENLWLQLRFSGISHHQLAGARVIARNAGGDIVGTRVVSSNRSYKSSNAMRVHLGLGKIEQVSIEVQLLNGGSIVSYPDLQANRLWDLNLEDESALVVYDRPLPGE